MPSLTGNWSEFDGATVTVRVGVSRQELLRLRSARQPVPQPGSFTGLIDTGAQATCIDPAAVRGLGLTLYGVTPVNVPATLNLNHPRRIQIREVEVWFKLFPAPEPESSAT